ncbi:MAG: formate dehydrogenase accessory protein FdhE [Shinella sp.]|nr:formate dehydrogenase accessory protein FdhE [Shinella sp.]
MSASSIQPDPLTIGRIPKTRFAFTPNPAATFRVRAARFEALAQAKRLRPYLLFMAGIARIQASLADSLSPVEPIPADAIERAREGAMPPIDRRAMAGTAAYRETLSQFLEAVGVLEMPAAAAAALAALRAAGDEKTGEISANVLSDTLTGENLAEHLYVAAATQVHAVCLAATLDAERLVPVHVGLCPACGGKPVASVVTGVHGVEGVRYAVCACCATSWNEVRVKCLACGSTKGIGYRAVEAGEEDATVKAEVCDGCQSWMKILYQNKNPSLDAVADDVASLGLDLLMKDTGYRRAGFHPFLAGY